MSQILLLVVLGCSGASLERLERPAEAEPPLPLVVAIHGLGDRPESLLALVASCGLPVRIVAPRGPDRAGDGFSWFDVTSGPEGMTFDADGITRSTDRLARLIDELQQTRTVPGEVVITGFSQGGILSFALAARHPDRIGTAIPIAGVLPVGLVPAGSPADRPTIHALHGRKDTVIPLAPTEGVVRKLSEGGWAVDLTVFDDAEHNVTPEMVRAMCGAIADAIPS